MKKKWKKKYPLRTWDSGDILSSRTAASLVALPPSRVSQIRDLRDLWNHVETFSQATDTQPYFLSFSFSLLLCLSFPSSLPLLLPLSFLFSLPPTPSPHTPAYRSFDPSTGIYQRRSRVCLLWLFVIVCGRYMIFQDAPPLLLVADSLPSAPYLLPYPVPYLFPTHPLPVTFHHTTASLLPRWPTMS